MEINNVLLARKCIFIIRFPSLQDKNTVPKKGIYFFDKRPFIVKAWNEGLILSKIGSMLGILIKTDKPTKEKIALSYARLLIKMPVNGLFPDSIDFISEGDGVIRQFVKYEWKPKKCIHCLMLGHEEQNCRKKYTVRQEWRVKQQPSVPIQAVEQ
ncbi:hypothetical protein Cgig2_020787 [Carnegiea gigantea]|uniref:DUF4283 domain-containing protein n=1 Tax=Carnegiea gigantea TaxID=171969 RepID=A0A9Q1GN66_9CARY|nr:hypothetical protein Cgig2_020787 [Carnegiea gigantea]